MSEKEAPLSNPARGCGHLKRGKSYIVGAGFSEEGVLPSWVELDPHLPFREIGTEGQFTRSFKRIDGLTLQLALEGGDDEWPGVKFVEHYPNEYIAPVESREQLLRDARENHVKKDVYGDLNQVPLGQTERHIDRISQQGTMGGRHWGNIPHAEQTDLLMRAGESYYPEPADFAVEATKYGLSKAIPVTPTRDPPTIAPGITRCWIMHPAACEGFGGGIIGFAYLRTVVFTEPEDGSLPDYIEDYEETGQLEVRDIEPPQEPEEEPDEDEDQTGVEDFIEGDDE